MVSINRPTLNLFLLFKVQLLTIIAVMHVYSNREFHPSLTFEVLTYDNLISVFSKN